jgi:CPA2 family monovalent cation:H+ antiporter-2
MAGLSDAIVYKDVLVVLATAGVTVPILHRFNVNPIVGFLGAGVVAGPWGLGALAAHVPILQWVTISNTEGMNGIAELGVVFLLFLIGLELSFERLKSMRRLVFGLGPAQLGLSALAIGAVVGLWGAPLASAIVVGMALALSSTAIVIALLSRQGRMASQTGRATFAMLLFEDIAVVPILFVVGVLATKSPDASLTMGLGMALGQAILAIVLIILFGRFVLRRLFRLVVGTGAQELFVAASLLVILGTGVVAAIAGMSMALGAFLAGLMLAETEYRRAIEATIEPFKGLLLGVFFFSVGTSIDIGRILADPVLIALATAGLLIAKAVIVFGLARVFSIGTPAAIESSFLMAAGGEFAFVVLGVALAGGVVSPSLGAAALAVTSLSMLLLPTLASFGRRISVRYTVTVAPEVSAIAPPVDEEARAIIVGYGRVGRLVADCLVEHRIPHLIVDRQVSPVSRGRREGRPIYFGDPTQAAFLHACGLDKALAVILTIDDPKAIDAIILLVRQLRPDIPVVARARDAEHARRLYSEGVTDAVPETIEASLQLSEASLVALGRPMGLVIASIHERRDQFRASFQAAAEAAAGIRNDSSTVPNARAVRAKRLPGA